MFANLFGPRRKRMVARRWSGRRQDRGVERGVSGRSFEPLERRRVLATFTPGNLVVFQTAETDSNSPASLIEISSTSAGQSVPVRSYAYSGARFSASATSTGYLSRSNDGALVAAVGAISTETVLNANTLTSRSVLVFDADPLNAGFTTVATYTGTSGNQPRAATTLDNAAWAIADQGGIYGNGSGPAPVGNFRDIKAFGGTLYVGQSGSTLVPVSTLSAVSAGAVTPLPGLPAGAANDFYLVQSGTNGAVFDVLYVLSSTSATAGTIAKYSLVSGSWVANGTVTTANAAGTGIGGFSIAARDIDATNVTPGAHLYVTSGTGATASASVYRITDAAGHNQAMSVSNADTVTLFTSTASAFLKGVEFAPVSAGPTIVGATTAVAFTTTYGSASAPQSFAVSGSGLTADLVATAPTGFEVSSDGTTYGVTATFTRSGGSAAGTLRVRLAATAVVGGVYDAQNVVLSTDGAASVNIVTAASGNAVTAQELTISGLTAENKNFDGTTAATVSGTPAYAGLVNGETFAVTGTVTWAFADAAVGAGKTLVRTGSYDTPSGNYTVTQPALSASILATAPAAPTINSITPGDGQLAVAFSPPVSAGGAAITDYEYSTDAGATFSSAGTTASPLLIAGLVNGTTYDVQLRAVNPVGSGAASAAVQGTPEVPAAPAISVSGLSGPLTTTYGTASAAASFTVSGASLVGDLTVTAPTGLEVSTNQESGYVDALPLAPVAGSVPTTTIYVRLKATAAAGAYNSRTISATSSGATEQTVTTAVAGNIVSQKALTITGLLAANRTYDRTTAVSVTGTPAYLGLAAGETFSVTGAVTWSFADRHVGTGKPLVRTGDYDAPSANYVVTQPALAANVTAAELTVSGASAANKVYDGTTGATIAGATLDGVIAGDDVTIATSTGSFASAAVGTGIPVTAALTLGGADAVNYALTQPAGLAADITKASQTIAFGPFGPQLVGGTVTATASSGLPVTYTISDATLAAGSGAGVALHAAGVVTITAAQAGDGNYDAAGSVTRTFRVIANAPTTLAAGDVAVIGYDTGGAPTDNFSILVLQDLGPGTVFHVNDNEVATGGTSFIDAGEAEATFTVLPGQVVAAGSVINLPWGNATVTDPRFTWAGHTTGGLGGSNEELFIYTAASATTLTPTAFIYGVRIGASTQGAPAALVEGTTFITPGGARARYLTAGAVYAGAKGDLLAAIGDIFNNWETAASSAGWVASSAWTFALPAPQSLSFAPLAGRTYGDASFELSATTSSGLPVSFISSDPSIASVSGTTVSILRAGTVTITASQAGDAAFAAAPNVERALVIAPKTITVAAEAKGKIYGDADPAFTYQVTGLVGSDALSGGLARAPGANVGVYAIGQGTLTGGTDYAISYTAADLTISAKALTVTASDVTKPFGTALTGGPGSTAFTSSGLVAGETIGSVTVAYGAGAGTAAAVGTYAGAVTVSAATGGTFTASNYDITYAAGAIVVSADPTISIGGSIGSLSTTYGTASSAAAFSVSGGFLSGDLTVTAPAGFEVSTSEGSGYGGTVTLTPVSGTLSATTVYVRLVAATPAGAHSGSVAVSGGGAVTQTAAIAPSSVAQKALAIGGLSAANRGYDGTTSGTVTGTPVYVGLVNGESFSVADAVTWSFATKAVGTGKPLVASGAYAAPSANYAVAQPTFAADVTAKELTVSGAMATAKAYDGTTAATITGATLVGVVAGDAVSIATSTGTFAAADAGTGVAVTAALALGGADAGNYTLAQPTGLSADITARALTITARNAYKAKGELLAGGPGSTAFTASGLQNGETIGSVTVAYGPAGGATGSGAVVGTYAGQMTISAATGGTFSAANYTIDYQSGTITVLNDLVVERIGDGTSLINGNAFGIAVLEVSAGGTAIETIVSAFQDSNRLTESGNSTSNGNLNTYAGFVAVPGLDTAPGTTPPVGQTSVAGLNLKAANVLAGASTTVAGRVTFPTDATIYAGNNFRSVIATSATTFYTTGTGSSGTGGVWYHDGATFTQVSTTVNNTRNVEIYNGNLYFSTGSGSQGIYQVGTGLPTAAGEVSTRIIAINDAFGFAISPDGGTAYVASNLSGLVKFTNAGGVWSQAYVVNATPARGLYVDFTGPEAVLFATASAVDPDPANPADPDLHYGNNKLLRIVDTGAGAPATEILTAGTSYVFRGVDYAPVSAAAPTIGTTGTLSGVATTYGLASAVTTVAVTGAQLTGVVTATAPAGFQVSSDGVTFGTTATFAPTAGVVSGTLSVRLAGTTGAGTHAGNVTLAADGATSVVVTVPSSTVSPKALTVRADDKTKVVNTANPALTATIMGFVNGETAAVVTGAAALETTALSGSAVGSYPITVGVGTLAATGGNYTFTTLVNGTLTVTSAPVRVTGVYVKGTTVGGVTGWHSNYLGLSPFTTLGTDRLGWQLRDGAAQLATSTAAGAGQVTWNNVNTISVRFDQAISAPQAAALRLVAGTGNRTIEPTSVTRLAADTVAQFVLPEVLVTGKYLLSIAATGIQDAAGTTVLDGEWTTSSSTFAAGSGDGTAGGMFNFAFQVLVGDVNTNGTANSSDVSNLRLQITRALGDAPTAATFRYDLNGSNVINASDVANLRLVVTTALGTNLNAYAAALAPTASLATIGPVQATLVTASGARLGATVTDDGGEPVLERGVVVLAGTTGTPEAGDAAALTLVSAGGTGTFTVDVTGLAASTVHRFRAFVRTSRGIVYSTIDTFTTAAAG